MEGIKSRFTETCFLKIVESKIPHHNILHIFGDAKILLKKIKKVVAFLIKDVYDIKCCGVIAVKREVATRE